MLNPDQAGLLTLLAATLVLFIWGKWRFDIVALSALTLAVLFGFIPADQAFNGFSHPATVTVAIILVISYGLHYVGVTEKIAEFVLPINHRPQLQLTILITIAALLSAVMNNIAALALTMPVAMQVFNRPGLSPAMVLMPLSFASILGGMITIIGTPPNIIISSYREQLYGTPFQMFDFSPVGGILACAGIIFIACLGWRMIPLRRVKTNKLNKATANTYIYEVRIDANARIVNKNIAEVEALIQDNIKVNLLSLTRHQEFYVTIPRKDPFINHDILLIEGTHDEIDKFIVRFNLRMISAENTQDSILHSNNTDTTEVVVLPTSRVEGRTPEQIRFRHYYDINLLAVARKGKSFRDRLRSFKFRVGDVLLLHGDKDELPEVVNRLGCLPLAQPSPKFGKRKHGLTALAIFAAGVVAASSGLLPLPIAFLMVAGGMIITNLIPIRDIYEQINWPIVILLGAMIPISYALDNTGTASAIVQLALGLTGNISPSAMLTMVFITTMLLSDTLNNAATALVMAPIANNLAVQLNANPDTFLMAVAIASSCAFLTPIGHQNNILIMEPGGYKFSDYWRLGLPLQIIMVIFAIPLLVFFWPL